MTAATISEHYHLEEGHVCIEFVNTAYTQVDPAAPHGYRPIDEHLSDLAALGGWGRDLGILAAAEAEVLREQGSAGEQERLAELRAVRESLRRLIRARLREQPLPKPDLAAVNRAFAPMLDRTALIAADGGFARVFTARERQPALERAFERLVWTIAQSTFDLLTDPAELALIRECPADDCGYLFRDTSHGRRRWCSMKSCGNRAKVQRFRDRQKAG